MCIGEGTNEMQRMNTSPSIISGKPGPDGGGRRADGTGQTALPLRGFRIIQRRSNTALGAIRHDGSSRQWARVIKIERPETPRPPTASGDGGGDYRGAGRPDFPCGRKRGVFPGVQSLTSVSLTLVSGPMPGAGKCLHPPLARERPRGRPTTWRGDLPARLGLDLWPRLAQSILRFVCAHLFGLRARQRTRQMAGL